jgi:hypothetical protein
MKPFATVYRGLRCNNVCDILIDEPGDVLRPLSPSPSFGLLPRCLWFDWPGGPLDGNQARQEQLALAILLDFTGSDEVALKHYVEFRRRHIARLPDIAVAVVTGTTIAAFLLDQGVDQAALQQQSTEDQCSG